MLRNTIKGAVPTMVNGMARIIGGTKFELLLRT